MSRAVLTMIIMYCQLGAVPCRSTTEQFSGHHGLMDSPSSTQRHWDAGIPNGVVGGGAEEEFS